MDICDNCGESHEGHYDLNTCLCFCCPECEDNYDREKGLPDSYNRYDNYPPYCDTKCDQCKNSPPDCLKFEPIN